MSDYVIVGDCGGTNTRLSLWEIPHDMMQKVNRTEKVKLCSTRRGRLR